MLIHLNEEPFSNMPFQVVHHQKVVQVRWLAPRLGLKRSIHLELLVVPTGSTDGCVQGSVG